MFQFPFGTMHQLNLDWFLQQWQQLRQDWIDEEQHIEDSMQDVYDARDAAIQAKDDAVSAKNDAESAQAGVHADALMAEGFAVGEQNGTPVGPGSPYYHVNAKYYSIEAGTYRYLSEAYARGTMGGTPVDPGDTGYEDNSKYYKEQADLDAQSASDDAAFAAADALKAEGFSVGEQNGTPVASGSPYYENNAKYYAGEAQQDKEDADTFKDAANQAALRSEGYALGTQNGTAVGSDSPYYENNAFYYFSNTANIDGENAQKMICVMEENSTTAAVEHLKGSFFRLAGKLYKATADIEIGDTITAGTNCEEIDVCSILDTTEIKGNMYGNIIQSANRTISMAGRSITLNKSKCVIKRTAAGTGYIMYCAIGNGAASSGGTIPYNTLLANSCFIDIPVLANGSAIKISFAIYPKIGDWRLVNTVVFADSNGQALNIKTLSFGTGMSNTNKACFGSGLLTKADIGSETRIAILMGVSGGDNIDDVCECYAYYDVVPYPSV